MTNTFSERYDRMILSEGMRALYDGTNFYNVGFWDKETTSLRDACSELVSKHLDKVNLSKSPNQILDVGCGLGMTSAMIKERFPSAKVTGINISEAQIAYAKSQYETIDFEVMNATQLDFPENTFDVIFSVEAAFHFDTRKQFLEEAFKVLKPGGQLIFTDLLLNDVKWVGDWSIPESNLLLDVNAYKEMLGAQKLILNTFEDITNESWMGFCNYINRIPNLDRLAKGLKDSIIAYMLVSLRK